MKLREYQGKAKTAIMGEFEVKQTTLAVLPTGSGKTIIAAHVASDFTDKGRVMVLAHRDELIQQAVAKFSAVTGIIPAIEKGEEWSDEDSMHGKPPIVISSFQTQNSGSDQSRRMHRFDPKEFAFLWIDEAHHSTAESFRRVIDYYRQGNPDLKILGVTATADRADGEALGQVYESCAFDYELPDIIHDGYLVPIRQRSVIIEGLDFSKVHSMAGDLNAAELEAAMMFEKPLHGVVHATIEVACGFDQGFLATLKDDENRADRIAACLAGKRRRRTLIFTVTIAHAQRMAEIINRWIPDSAAWVDGEMPIEDRKRTLKAFSRGEFQFLTSCMICTEGYDEPGIEVVVMARPTKSRALFVQMTGRGTRPLDSLAAHLGDLPDAGARRNAIINSAKPYVEVLDFVGNSGRHKLITAIDILGCSYESDVVERAKELAQEKAVEVEEALTEAAKEIEEEREAVCMAAEAENEELEAEAELRWQAEVARRARLVGTTIYQVSDAGNDPYLIRPERVNAPINRGGATDKQIDFLVKLGVQRKTAEGYSKKQAGAVIESMKQKQCTRGQASFLRHIGYSESDISEMNFYEASAAIEESKAGAA